MFEWQVLLRGRARLASLINPSASTHRGAAAGQAAERAGHGVDVMLRVYAKCIDGQREIANQRIEGALAS